MQRKTSKLLLDVGLYVTATTIAVTGFIIGWVIPRGGGRGGDRFFLGLHRHGWADIHLVFAVLFVSMLVVHLMWNWKWTVSATKGLLGTSWKPGLVLVACSWIPILFVAWLVALIGSCAGC